MGLITHPHTSHNQSNLDITITIEESVSQKNNFSKKQLRKEEDGRICFGKGNPIIKTVP